MDTLQMLAIMAERSNKFDGPDTPCVQQKVEITKPQLIPTSTEMKKKDAEIAEMLANILGPSASKKFSPVDK